MGIADTESALLRVEQSLDKGQYIKGAWQRVLGQLEELDAVDKRELSDLVSRVSRKLHGRNRYKQVPFPIALGAEVALLLISIALLFAHNMFVLIAGIGTLALCLQPLIKVLAGLLLGVRYDYAYLWFLEPRFKMRYGSYLLLTGSRRVVLHLLGSLGTPAAMLVGFFVFYRTNQLLGVACLVFFGIATLMQVGAFTAEWLGVKSIGSFRLSTLTSPATAAFEWKRLRRVR